MCGFFAFMCVCGDNTKGTEEKQIEHERCFNELKVDNLKKAKRIH